MAHDVSIYVDYEGWGYGEGTKVSVKRTDFTRVQRSYLRSFESLASLSVQADASFEYGPAAGTLVFQAKNEQHLKEQFEETYSSELERITTAEFTVSNGSNFGTVFYCVDMQFGGIRVKVPIGHLTDLWTRDKLQQFMDYDMAPAMEGLTRGFSMSPKAVTRKVLVYPSITGKTCHHVQFQRVHNDQCRDDGSNCVTLSNEFVVCHHHAFTWIGGPNCNCNHVDGFNVVRLNAKDLSPLYA